jgi:hypothetical protein
LERKEVKNNEEKLQLIKEISPVAWQHANLLGHYDFNPSLDAVNIEKIISKLKVVV